uniref:Uncharacterized protein n=1 Tax=Mycena chlorophos TaxID=658473 RepID=A0ABQ0L0T8_MYCCL|nr:predicted protein [Mycena chlorophos]
MDSPHRPPLGNVVAVKHARPAIWDPRTKKPNKKDLFTIPLVPMVPEDVSAVNEMVRDACFALWHVVRDWTYFVPSITAMTTFYEDGGRVYPPIPSAEQLEAIVRSYSEQRASRSDAES